MNLDERLLVLARTRGHSAAAERAVARFSRLGEHGGVWLAMGVLGAALDGGRREGWLRATRTIAGTYALNTAIKLLVRRRRPELPGLPPLTSTVSRLSFPSAHASTSFAAAGLYRRMGLPAPALYVLASALAWSRLYLGVHYPSDVLGGALLGGAAGRGSQVRSTIRYTHDNGTGSACSTRYGLRRGAGGAACRGHERFAGGAQRPD